MYPLKLPYSYTMYPNHLAPSKLSQDAPSHLPLYVLPSFFIFIYLSTYWFSTHWVRLVLPVNPWVCSHLLGLDLPVATVLRKSGSYSIIQLPGVPQLWAGLWGSSQSMPEGFTVLILGGSCAGSHRCCKRMCTTATSFPEDSISQHS